jgi:hypothetical protein
MQSPNGELAFGGRSNQFIHNEAWLCVIYEYEAKRYAREGNLPMAKKFKAAIKRALDVSECWLTKEPLYHIKNRLSIPFFNFLLPFFDFFCFFGNTFLFYKEKTGL